ncbi:MAG: DUF1080 domain-containing protein [Verrucomicrobia bacterium]|nr:DUF1080 domain-containing protein [Verrucomicrobiota bacterium]
MRKLSTRVGWWRRVGYVGSLGLAVGLGPTAASGEFESLFDGATLKGWHVSAQSGHSRASDHKSGGRWVVEEGAIVGSQDVPGNGGIILTDEEFGDFEVALEMNNDFGPDSGLFLRSTENGRAYQAMIDYHGRGNLMGIYGEGIGGFGSRNYNFDGAPDRIALRENAVPLPILPEAWKHFWRHGQWNELRARIVNNPPSITTWINGVKIMEWSDTQQRLPDRGRIALQVHGGGDLTRQFVRYRNIRVKRLSPSASGGGTGQSSPGLRTGPQETGAAVGGGTARAVEVGGAAVRPAAAATSDRAKAGLWRAVHLMAPEASRLPVVQRAIVEVLAPLGVNAIVFEVNYRFAWRSHPELAAGGALTAAQARELSAVCRRHGIRLIPLFNCLGHQSWAQNTQPLLKRYPEFDETPQIPPDNAGIYCRSWCPQHPGVNRVVFALMDELLEAFEADALHVGMDEVFLIGHDQCERCRGQDPAALFARAVNDYHRHLVGTKGVEMLLWGDRLLDDATMKYGEWESSRNGTAGAIDRIPKDIIVCDWHYELRETYPSVPYFQAKGFRVLPASWRKREAALALLSYSQSQATDKWLGHLCTTWIGADQLARALLGEEGGSAGRAQEVAAALRACLERLGAAADGGPSKAGGAGKAPAERAN